MTQGDLFNVLFALVTINVGLTFATFGVGIYAEFPFDILMGWCGLTLIFGLMCVAPMVKIAYKRKEGLQKLDEISYR
ncbi:hypothetical protein BC833DRAFT_591769 [Globomyces pollinis-pini]|nr:hypothetical protein BC833DRAFT_591769 [Globomyces pollinis-pini]